VEFALLAPLVFAIAFGTITGGLAWNAMQSLNHAAREGARHAATLPIDGTLDGWLNGIALVVAGSSSGQLNAAPGRYVCVAYIGPTTRRRVDDGGTVSYSSSACFDDGRGPDEPRVQVSAGREVDFIGILYNALGLPLRADSVARHEPTAHEN
jgi:hypothetical protein